ncbi:MAG: GTP cyclohydrolase I FolE, partial [Planctomycetes bacterium]|nr:GTP cyclohydrolase I FolE [Planctomycetota bacterium]
MGYNNRSSHGPYAPPALDGLSLAMGSKSNSASKIQVDHARIEAAVREILCAVGENPDREGLLETPSRVARMYEEIFAGLREDPRKHMQKTFAEKYDEMVLVRDITFASCCEHHLLPFFGECSIAYVPNGKIIGLSKIPKLVDLFAQRLQVQEDLTHQIGTALQEAIKPKGLAVFMSATHLCAVMRN